MMKRNANAKWQGSIKEGKGNLSTDSEILKETPYSFSTRFGDKKGTNPEELIAAAHAGCFTMALSKNIGDAGGTVNELKTDCAISMEGLEVVSSDLNLVADVDGLSKEEIEKAIRAAEKNCPISKLLNAEIKVDFEIK